MDLMNASSFVLLAFLMFFVPLYVNHLEKSWFRRVFGCGGTVTSMELRSALDRMNDNMRSSVVRVTLAIDAFIATVILLFPLLVTSLVAIFLLATYIAYRKDETTRKCPFCFSLIPDPVTTCPHCAKGIGLEWAVTAGKIKANWLTQENRFFRYKCS
jgi:hypothetical protein